jgi:hypothetical protein
VEGGGVGGVEGGVEGGGVGGVEGGGVGGVEGGVLGGGVGGVEGGVGGVEGDEAGRHCEAERQTSGRHCDGMLWTKSLPSSAPLACHAATVHVENAW